MSFFGRIWSERVLPFVLARGPLLWAIALLVALPAALRTGSLYAHLKADVAALLPVNAPSVQAKKALFARATGLTYLGVDHIEAWVTDGRCTDKGPERAVDAIRLNWRADLRDAQEGRQCMQTERCTHTENNVIEGKFLRCATAAARQGNQTAYISSDEVRCN